MAPPRSDSPRDDDDDGDEEGKARWLTTYGDAMTLLLVFFVILISMSEIDPKEFHIVISSFKGAVGVFESGRTMTPAQLMDMGINVHKLSQAKTTVNENIPQQVQTVLETKETKAKVRQDERGLVIQVTNRILFNRGEVKLSPEGKQFLGRVAQLLSAPELVGRDVRVEGHTDNIPVENWDSNWKISVLRASNVVETLINSYEVDPDRLSAVGFGPTRPIASNKTAEGRAKNRRVEIVVLRETMRNQQPERMRR